MNGIISEIVAFMRTGTASDALRPAVEKLGTPRMRGALSELLAWLSRSPEAPYFSKPLRLRVGHPWSRDLEELRDLVPGFSDFFAVSTREFNFRDSVSEEERRAIREWVRHNDTPTLFVDWKPRRVAK